MSETLNKLKAQFKKMRYEALEHLMAQLTIEQREKLSRICGGNGKIPESKINQAIELCERTIKVNKETVTIRGCEHKEVVGHKFCTECGKSMWITTRIEPKIEPKIEHRRICGCTGCDCKSYR